MSLLLCGIWYLALTEFGFRMMWTIMEIEEGVASADNTLRDLHNSSDDVKATKCADFLFLLFQDIANKT